MTTCESCSMPIESGRYCPHCVDDQGNLQSFEERVERMCAWQSRRDPNASAEQVRAATLAFLSGMPAWRDHPAVRAAAAGAPPPASGTW